VIDHVRGSVARLAEDHVVVDVGGVGFRLEAAPAMVAALQVGEHRELPTSLVVREDSLTLYGFVDLDSREVFELVQTISGIGPRTAQALVATLTADGLRAAVHRQDVNAVMKVPGIGRKGAQRILLELADRLGPPSRREPGAAPTEPSPASGAREDALAGLVSLGWSHREAESALRAVAEQVEPDAGVATLLKAALAELRRA
jgi:Holliday junction DNA helicase RuvA